MKKRTYRTYQWQDNSISPNYIVTNPGNTLEATDDLACTLTGAIKIIKPNE